MAFTITIKWHKGALRAWECARKREEVTTLTLAEKTLKAAAGPVAGAAGAAGVATGGVGEPIENPFPTRGLKGVEVGAGGGGGCTKVFVAGVDVACFVGGLISEASDALRFTVNGATSIGRSPACRAGSRDFFESQKWARNDLPQRMLVLAQTPSRNPKLPKSVSKRLALEV